MTVRKDGMLHIDRIGLLNRVKDRCHVCGREFLRTNEHVYRHSGKNYEPVYECSYSCYRRIEREIEAQRQAEEDEETKWLEAEQKRLTQRIAQCETKLAQAAEAARKAPKGRERKTAQAKASDWRCAMRKAQADLRRVSESLSERSGTSAQTAAPGADSSRSDA